MSISLNRFSIVHNQENSMQTKWQPSKLNKAQGWTNKQKAAVAAATIGAAGLALKTLAYFRGQDSYAQMSWDHTFGWVGDVLNRNVVEPGISGLSAFGRSAYETVCKKPMAGYDLGKYCIESKDPCKTNADCTKTATDVCRDLADLFGLTGDRCVDASRDLSKFAKNAFCTTTFGHGYGC